jgi:hypothetical protein
MIHPISVQERSRPWRSPKLSLVAPDLATILSEQDVFNLFSSSGYLSITRKLQHFAAGHRGYPAAVCPGLLSGGACYLKGLAIAFGAISSSAALLPPSSAWLTRLNGLFCWLVEYLGSDWPK